MTLYRGERAPAPWDSLGQIRQVSMRPRRPRLRASLQRVRHRHVAGRVSRRFRRVSLAIFLDGVGAGRVRLAGGLA